MLQFLSYSSGRRLHDHEVLVELADLSHHRELLPAVALAVRGHGDCQPALRRQPLEHKLFR